MIVFIGNVNDTGKTLNDIFRLLWINGLIDSHVLIQDESKIWTLYAFMPFQNDCFTPSAINIASFTPFNYTENIAFSIDKLYPKKMKNFYNCPLVAAISSNKPFVIIHNVSDLTNLEGIDIAIINEISKRLNMTIIYKYADNFKAEENFNMVN